MDDMPMRSWEEFYRYREQVKSYYPTIWKVPIVKKELDRLLPNIKENSRVLEIGAGRRKFMSRILAHRKGVVYESMDVDPDTEQTYYDLDKIKQKYDMIFMFEVIEHVPVTVGFSMLEKIRGMLSDGGVMILGTPNIYHPNRYHGVLSHQSPYKYEDLGAFVQLAGFTNVKIYRMFNDAFLRRVFRLYIGVWLHKYLGIDFAGTILLEATPAVDDGGKRTDTSRGKR